MSSVKVAPEVGEMMEEGELDAVPKGAEDGMDNPAPVVGKGPPKVGKEPSKVGVLEMAFRILVATVEKDKSLEDARLEKNVPVAVLVPVWMIGKIVFLFVLAYLATTSTLTDQVKMYLSPIYVFGSSSDYRLCELIPSSFSGTFLLDSRGNWQGTTAFQGGKAKYMVTFNDFSHTYKEYYEILSKMKAAIASLAVAAKTTSLQANLLKFMSYAWVYADGQVNHVLRFVADPADVFNKQYMRAALLSRLTPCGATPTVEYDAATGDVAVRYDIYSYAQLFNPAAGAEIGTPAGGYRGLKGCCEVGTVYTKIGNPGESTVEVSSTWGAIYSYGDTVGTGPTAQTTYRPVTLSIVSTSSPLLSPQEMTLSLGGTPSASDATPVTGAVAKAVVSFIADVASNPKKFLLCTYRDNTKCVTVSSVTNSGLTAGGNCKVTYTAANSNNKLTRVGDRMTLYLVDLSLITNDDIGFVQYQFNETTLTPSNAQKLEAFLGTTKFKDTELGYPGLIELSTTNTSPTYLDRCLLDPTYYGYNTAFDAANFAFKYNIRSVITAVAVNNDLLPLSALQEVYGSLSITVGCVTDAGLTLSGGVCQLTFNGDTYTIRTYIDPKYSKMDPIYCLARTTSAQASYTFTTMCLLRVGASYVYPFFNHMGTTAQSYTPSDDDFYDPGGACSCAASAYDANYLDPTPFSTGSTQFAYKIKDNSAAAYCNVMDLMHGFVMMNNKKVSATGSQISVDNSVEYKLRKFLQMASGNTAEDIQSYAYVAGFSALRISYGIQVLQQPQSSEGWGNLYGNLKDGTGAGPLQFCNGYAYSADQQSNPDALYDLAGQSLTDPDCTIYAMNSFDKSLASVNSLHVNLLASHCADEFSMPDSSWSRNSTWRYDTNDVPIEFNEQAGAGALFVSPQDLVQSYYVCYNSLTTSLSIAFGSSVGTASIAAAITLTLMITTVTACCSKMPDNEKRKAGSISQGAVLLMGAVGAGIGVASVKR